MIELYICVCLMFERFNVEVGLLIVDVCVGVFVIDV
jgi:hypothetical protein